ncbi:MAG TPA: hypothetical protein VFQ61_12070 [Polyangiaceae bacterium]|nr:hypothetical protein [Polyangiaceae bacterium]
MNRFLLLVAFGTWVLACKSEDQAPPQQGGYPPQYPQQQYPQQQYPQQQYPQQQYPQQQYPQQQYPTAAQPAPVVVPTAAAPATTAPAGTMSTPSPLAFPCSSDAQCFTHRCNTQVGRCAWPCQSDADCVTGRRCQASQCL